MAKAEEVTTTLSETKEMSEEELRAKRAALIAELAALPAPPAPVGVQPGTILNPGTPGATKMAWTWNHLRERQAAGDQEFREVTFTPIFSAPLTWNGLTVDLVAGEEITTFAIFKGEYDKVRRARGINDSYFGPLRPDEKQAYAGFRSRVHRMNFGGLDPRPGAGSTPGIEQK